jgi:hypothetical protein
MSSTTSPVPSQPDSWAIARKILALNVDENDPVYILPDFSIIKRKKPEKYLGILYIRSLQEKKIETLDENINEILNALSTITKKIFSIEERTTIFEAYMYKNKMIWIDDAEERTIIIYAGAEYYMHFTDSQRWAIAHSFEDRFTSRYNELISKYNLFTEATLYSQRYPAVLVKMPKPSNKFITIINTIISTTTTKSIDDEIREKIEQIKKLAKEVRELREKKKTTTNITTNILRIENVITNITKQEEKQEVKP